MVLARTVALSVSGPFSQDGGMVPPPKLTTSKTILLQIFLDDTELLKTGK